MTISDAKKILGKNIVGPDELASVATKLHIVAPKNAPEIPFSKELLRKHKDNAILILGVGKDKNNNLLTINQFRTIFGVDPAVSEPCMYNQDWYLKEKFASEAMLEQKWYLLSKGVVENTRALDPKKIKEDLPVDQIFPSAVLTVFAFFAYYFINNGEVLWKNDFLWCSDTDANGDCIYTGRYSDPKGMGKNGFNVHRYLSLSPAYGSAPEII